VNAGAHFGDWRIGRLLGISMFIVAALAGCPLHVDSGVSLGGGRDLRLPLSPEDRSYLASLPPLRVGVDPLWAPMAFVDSQGRIGGISADYLNFLQKTLSIRFEIVPTRSWGETVRFANEGRIDIVVAASQFDGLGPGFGLSTPYVRYPLVIVTRETAPFIGGLEDLEGAQVAVVGDVQTTRARFPGMTRMHAVTVGSADDGLEAVAQGYAFAYIGNLGVIDRIVRERYAGTLRVAAPADRIQELSFGLAPRFAPLLPLVNRVLSSIPEAEREHIQNTWLSTRFTFGIAPRTLWLVLAPVGSLTFVFLVVLWLNMLRLRKEVQHRRRTAKRELELKRRLIELTQELPSVVFQLNFASGRRPRFQLVFANRRADELLGTGRTAGSDGFASFIQALDPEQRRRLTRMFLRSARSQQRVGTEFEFDRGDSKAAWFHVEAAPRMCEDDSVQWSGYLHDVTQAREAQSALMAAMHDAKEAARARDSFIATVSHEIRTPMSGIVSILQLLEHDGLSPDDRQLVDMAGNAAELLLRILNDILDFAKSENGDLSLESASMSMEEIVRRCTGLVTPDLERKALRLYVDVASAIAPRHIGDAQRIGQVLLNLLGNAVKFTDEGSVSLTVDVIEESADRQILSIVVTDTGIGIARDDQAQLFIPFSQARSLDANRYGGTGLGLAICKRLVEQMGGSISLESEPGRGTAVTIVLALRIDHSAERVGQAQLDVRDVSAAPASVPSRSEPRVLLVEDRSINREVLRRQLASLRVTDCQVAENGAQALSAYARNQYEMIITDCAMPVLSGVELMRAIRRHEQGVARQTVLIALTADATQRQRDACIEAGADEVCVKPLSLERLRDLLERYGILAVGTEQRLSAGVPIEQQADLSRRLRQTLATDLQALLEAAEAGRRETLRDIAHSIAGTAGWFQVRSVADAAARLQECLDERVAWQVPLSALRSTLERALDELGDHAGDKKGVDD
jgi:two-component system, NarL family, sensor histidine kinase EvgS